MYADQSHDEDDDVKRLLILLSFLPFVIRVSRQGLS
jgi:hypothetical protein